MSTLVNVHYPAEHPGLVRLQNVRQALKELRARFDGAAGTATLLLAALVAAVLVVANQIVETWSDGSLLAAWIGLWVVGFAALALLADPARRAAHGLRERFSHHPLQHG